MTEVSGQGVGKSKSRIIFLCGVLLCLAGCGRVSIERFGEHSFEKNITIEVREDKAVSSWWGPLKSQIKDKIIETIKGKFREYALYVVNEKADIVVILQDIITAGAADSVQVEEVILLVTSPKGEIFKLRYRQKATQFPDDWYKFWAYANSPQGIARILGERIVYELGMRGVRIY